jgi:hypothetical protein
MIQYDLKKRLSAEELYHHPFLTTPYSQLTKIIIRRNSNKVIGSQVLMNAKKMNESIWDVFGEEREILDGIHSQRVNTNNNQNIKNNYLNDIKAINLKDSGSLLDEIHEKKTKIDLKKEFLNAFDEMNEDFIYFEPKLIPIIPGDDPTVINKVSEFSEDNF